MQAVGYIRVSTEDQQLGPEVQRRGIVDYCASKGYELVQVYEDHGVSGATPAEERPGLLEALNSCAAGVGVVVVLKRDRLARDVVQAAVAEKLAAGHGGRIETVNGVGNGSSPEDALMRTIVDAFAAYERALIRARTTAALAAKRARGERVGQVPYGFRADAGMLVEHPEEQQAIRRICELADAGASKTAITMSLNKEAASYPPRGKRWHRTTVTRILEVSRQNACLDSAVG